MDVTDPKSGWKQDRAPCSDVYLSNIKGNPWCEVALLGQTIDDFYRAKTEAKWLKIRW